MRALPAQCDHPLDGRLGAGDNSLERAVPPVAHPAGQLQVACTLGGPIAIAHPLDPALDSEMDGARGSSGHQLVRFTRRRFRDAACSGWASETAALADFMSS